MRRQQNKSLIQFSYSDTDFLIGQSNHEVHFQNRSDKAAEKNTLKNTSDVTQGTGLQMEMPTLEKNIIKILRNEVDSMMTIVQTRVKDTVLTAIFDCF